MNSMNNINNYRHQYGLLYIVVCSFNLQYPQMMNLSLACVLASYLEHKTVVQRDMLLMHYALASGVCLQRSMGKKSHNIHGNMPDHQKGKAFNWSRIRTVSYWLVTLTMVWSRWNSTATIGITVCLVMVRLHIQHGHGIIHLSIGTYKRWNTHVSRHQRG